MLEAGLQIAARDAPRVKVDNDGGFYGPDLNSSSSFSAVYPSIYTAVLENLQDEHVPYCKVLSIRMDTDYISELRAYAIVQFEEFPGVSKTITRVVIDAPKETLEQFHSLLRNPFEYGGSVNESFRQRELFCFRGVS